MTYDIAIIGCGPAGLTAAIYALRANKKVVIFEKENIGGKITSSPLVENYPGFKEISGTEFANHLYEQVESLGGDIILEEVTAIKNGKLKNVITEDDTYKCRSIIIATGSKYRMLGLEKEEDFVGNGISFCVACDGAFYLNQTVAVIGGGNSAIINAISLSDICKKVYVVQNENVLTGEKVLIERLLKNKNVEVLYNSLVTELKGEDELTGIKVKNTKDETEKVLKLDGMFVSIGQVPESDFLKKTINLGPNAYIESDESCKTNVDGIFVAGDCRTKKIRQLTTATSDGTIAALQAVEYLDKSSK